MAASGNSSDFKLVHILVRLAGVCPAEIYNGVVTASVAESGLVESLTIHHV